jgi:acetoin utilization deacetylase AcuC-like enzyme
MSVYLISHPACLRHAGPAHHPECPERLTAISDQCIAAGIEPFLQHQTAPRATREQLLRVHTAAHLEALEAARPPADGWLTLDGGDTFFGPESLEAAYRAAGAVVLGVDLALGESPAPAFCSVRPPGHHAGPGEAMGFCLFNNVAVGAAHALAAHGLERVSIVDFDVHHGNGTEAIFRDEPRVLFCSSFQHPFYPFSGADTRSGHILNLPLPAGTDGAALRAAVEQVWWPALEAFAPQLILVSAGFDGHREDDMARFRLVEADYAWLTRGVRDIALRHCGGRIVSTLEGGYQLSALGRSVVAHLRALAGLGA